MRLGINGAIFLLCGFLLGCTQEREMTGPWQLDNEQSRLSFVSTKAVDVSEVHRFSELSGSVSVAGEARVAVELASVDTLIPIRDERMRELLFETQTFPQASLAANVDIDGYLAMPAGSSLAASEQIMVNMRGISAAFEVDLLVTKVAADRFVVASLQPILVSADTFGLSDGVEALRAVAGLPSIGGSVPVSFVLSFVRLP
jgi:hypothetical protein